MELDRMLMNVTQISPVTGNLIRYFRTRGAADRFSTKLLLENGINSCSIISTGFSFGVCWRRPAL